MASPAGGVGAIAAWIKIRLCMTATPSDTRPGDRPQEAGRRSGLAGHGLLALKLAVTGGSLWWVARRVDTQAISDVLHAASRPLLTVSFGFFLLVAILGGLRWWVILRAMGQPAGLGVLTGLFWTGMAMGQILPTAAGDAARVWLTVRRGCALRAAINSIILERVFMLAILLVIVLATYPWIIQLAPDAPPIWLFALLALGGVGGVAALSVAEFVAPLRAWPALAWLGALSHDTRAVTASVWSLPATILCVVANLNFVAAGGVLGAALGLGLGPSAYLAAIPLVIMVTIIPISIGGWGLREGLLVSLLAHSGVPPHMALAFSVMFGVMTAACSLPGLIFWWLQPDRATGLPT